MTLQHLERRGVARLVCICLSAIARRSDGGGGHAEPAAEGRLSGALGADARHLSSTTSLGSASIVCFLLWFAARTAAMICWAQGSHGIVICKRTGSEG